MKADVALFFPIESDEPDFSSVDIIGIGVDEATTFIATDPSGDIGGLLGTGMHPSYSRPSSRFNIV